MDSNVKAAVLLVDDEAAILSALQRVFRKSGYQILTAESGEQALDVLTREAVDVVLTDMRMPGMDGSELLQRVRRNWPNVSRVLMTGHADLNQTIRAINEAGIHHYIGKPWDDDELLSVMAEALDRALVYREHQRLLQVTQTQNARLTDLTNALEAKVKARTAELQDVNEKLERTNKSLTRAYRSTIKVLSAIIEMTPGIEKGFAQQVAETAYAIGRIGGIERRELLYLYFAAQLHELGKVALDRELISTSPGELSHDELALYRQYPMLGGLALEGVDYLSDVARFIATHQENWNGSGFPHRLKAHDIPMGGRIVRVARDYVLMINGLERVAPNARPRHAMTEMHSQVGGLYDSEVLVWLERFVERRQRDEGTEDERLTVARQLMPGMVVSRDFYTSHGVLMLARNHVLTERNVDHLVDLQQLEKGDISVWVQI